MSERLSHLNEAGEANMVDISEKDVTARSAIAQARVRMQPATLEAIQGNALEKGEVFAVARIAGIQAAKRCSDLIPLCHPLALSKVSVEFAAYGNDCVDITAEVRVTGKTGVEMEALAAASVAALTVYDMCKAVDKGMVVEQICLLEKRGGRSGVYMREGE